MALRWLQSVFTEANGQAALQNYASSVPRETKLNALLGRASQSVPAGVGLRLTHSPVVNPGIQKVLAVVQSVVKKVHSTEYEKHWEGCETTQIVHRKRGAVKSKKIV